MNPMTNEMSFEIDPRDGLPDWLKKLADAGLGPDDTEQDRLRKRVMTLTTMTLVAVIGGWPITYLILGLYGAAIIPATYVLITAVAFVVFARTKNGILFRNVQFGLLLVFPALLQWLLGGYVGGSAVVIFAALAPILSLMVVGRRSSVALMAGFAAIVAGLGLADVLIARAAPVVPTGVAVGLTVLNIVGVVVIVYFPLSFYITAFTRAHVALQVERQRSDQLMDSLMPAAIASRLKGGEQVIADQLSGVAVLFADMVGFTSVTQRLPAGQVVRRLNLAFTSFDRLTDEFGLDKIKTIGDSYMVASGLSGDDPASVHVLADLALAMREASRDLSLDGESPLELRFGIDVGPVIAGVVGEQMLSYDLYGDVVNTASRMASHATPGRIQVTARVRNQCDGEFVFESRGSIEVKGKGSMETFFLDGRAGSKPFEKTETQNPPDRLH
jgi:guanylate cyclase